MDVAREHAFYVKVSEQAQIWHARLGHPSSSQLRKTLPMVTGLPPKLPELTQPCDDCVRGKHSRELSKDPMTRSGKPLEKVHIDVWGPSRTVAVGEKARYYLVVVDDFSRRKWTIPLKDKSGATLATAFENWLRQAER